LITGLDRGLDVGVRLTAVRLLVPHRRRPDKLHADKAYGYRRCRAYLLQRGYKVRIAARDRGQVQARAVRWVVEPSPAPSSKSAD